MKSLLTLALLALTALPLAAQRVEPATATPAVPPAPTSEPGLPTEPPTPSPTRRPPTPAAALGLTMQTIDGVHLLAKLQVQAADSRPVFVFLLGSLDPTLGQWAGLPATLLDATVLTVVEMRSDLTYDLGPAAFGYTWYLQGLAFRDWEFASSDVRTIAPR